ncbi:MAG: endonuclease III [Bacteroidales bacterium]|nr:endonuclease III [Bacteroidales bacterium]
MTRKERYRAVVEWFSENVPAAKSELHYDNAFQLLVAVILSAQCTDKRVNMTTPAIFEKYPDPASMAAASFEELYPLVKSISYPNSKTAHLIGMAEKLISDFDGQVPSDMDALQSLPGVGQKTASVIASIVYNQPKIAVDTHVFRVSHRLGLSDGKTPEAVQKDLEGNIPVAKRAISHHWLILHGRYTCTARNPKCASCGLAPSCRQFAKENSSSL